MNIKKLIKHLKTTVHSKRFDKVRRIVVAVAGGIVILIGVALIFLPGPAFVVIPAGFALLATEFTWAKRLFKTIRAWTHKVRSKLKIARRARSNA